MRGLRMRVAASRWVTGRILRARVGDGGERGIDRGVGGRLGQRGEACDVGLDVRLLHRCRPRDPSTRSDAIEGPGALSIVSPDSVTVSRSRESPDSPSLVYGVGCSGGGGQVRLAGPIKEGVSDARRGRAGRTQHPRVTEHVFPNGTDPRMRRRTVSDANVVSGLARGRTGIQDGMLHRASAANSRRRLAGEGRLNGLTLTRTSHRNRGF